MEIKLFEEIYNNTLDDEDLEDYEDEYSYLDDLDQPQFEEDDEEDCEYDPEDDWFMDDLEEQFGRSEGDEEPYDDEDIPDGPYLLYDEEDESW